MLNHRSGLTECFRSPQRPQTEGTCVTPAMAVRARTEVRWEQFKKSQRRSEQVTGALWGAGERHGQ